MSSVLDPLTKTRFAWNKVTHGLYNPRTLKVEVISYKHTTYIKYYNSKSKDVNMLPMIAIHEHKNYTLFIDVQ